MGKEVIVPIGILAIVLTVLLTLFFMAIVDFGSEDVIPTGQVVFAQEKSVKGSVEVVLERLRFPLARNLMIVSVKNMRNEVIKPTIRVVMMADTFNLEPLLHCDITPDVFVKALKPGEKQQLEIPFKGCAMHNQRGYETVTMTIFALDNQGRELGSVTRRLDLRG